MERKLGAADYYELLPEPAHRPGDIWSQIPLPTTLSQEHGRGILISPACDLSNSKLETLTFLPILRATEWFHSTSFHPLVCDAANEALAILKANTPRLPRYPTADDIATLQQALQTPLNPQAASTEKTKEALRRIATAAQALKSPLPDKNIRIADAFTTKTWRDICTGLIRNSLRPDIHYIPPDKQDEDWSGITTHSVVLLRHPTTLPIRALNYALEVSSPDWNARLSQLPQRERALFAKRPLKHVRLRERFFADLLSRYLALYARIGAPTPTDNAVDDAVTELSE